MRSWVELLDKVSAYIKSIGRQAIARARPVAIEEQRVHIRVVFAIEHDLQTRELERETREQPREVGAHVGDVRAYLFKPRHKIADASTSACSLRASDAPTPAAVPHCALWRSSAPMRASDSVVSGLGQLQADILEEVEEGCSERRAGLGCFLGLGDRAEKARVLLGML